MGDLDYEHRRLPFVTVANRGSGKVNTEERGVRRDRAEADMDLRQEILAYHRFASRFQRRAWTLYAAGQTVREVATELGENVTATWRTLRDVRRAWSTSPGPQLRMVAKACDPELVLLFFGLLRRAAENPGEMTAALNTAEQGPALADVIRKETVQHG